MWKTKFSFISVLILSACSVGSQDPAPVRHYGVEEGAGTLGKFTVLEGDTLWSVSKRFKIDMRDLIDVNRLSEPYALRVGQRLDLPAPREYVVQHGDTLYSISRLFDTNTSELARLNDLDPPYTLMVRQTLNIPSRTQEPEVAAIEPVQVDEVATVGRVDRETLATPQDDRTAGVTPGRKPQPPYKKTASVNPNKRASIPSRTPKRSSSKFLKPVEGQIVSGYGPKDGGLHNDGINIKAPKGAPVRAAENGVVVYAGNDLKGTGNLILVRHEDRWMSAYAHLDKKMVTRGDVIRRGQTIGTVGASGSVDSPQLHFELRRGTKALNPKVYIEG